MEAGNIFPGWKGTHDKGSGNFNSSLSNVWSLIENPSAMWVKILQARYFSDSSFWTARKGGTPSWIWSSLLKARQLIVKGFAIVIGDGALTNVWQAKWIPSQFKPLSLTYGDQSTLLVKDLFDNDPPTWNLNAISHILIVQDQMAITAVPLHNTMVPDRLFWPLHNSGNYSVKSAYHLISANGMIPTTNKASASHQIELQLWKWIWSLHTLPKIKFFLWKATQNFMATKAVIQAEEFITARSLVSITKSSSLDCPTAPPYWIPPHTPGFKINTDATRNRETFSCGLAALLRDSSSSLKNGLVSVGQPLSAESTEAQVVLLCLKLAKSHSLLTFSLKADCLPPLSALKSSEGLVSWSVFSWLQKIKTMVDSFSLVNWSWISREANTVVDCAAHLASRLECSMNWIHNPPTTLLHVLQSNAVAAPP
ncbi:hypothetical protein ACLB2K_065417 [Fragaria x ananassa]